MCIRSQAIEPLLGTLFKACCMHIGDTSGANFDTFTPKQAHIALQVIQNLLATKPLNADEDWHGKSRHIVSITDNAVLLNSFGQ